jgi:hypothetical protein
MVAWIVYWGAAALLAAVLGAILAVYKRYDVSKWAAWCFVLPPLVVVLLLLPRNTGPRPSRPSLDEEDALVGRD